MVNDAGGALVQPAEWTDHEACLTAFPEHEYAWGDELAAAQGEFATFIETICEQGAEPVWLLCPQSSMARGRLSHLEPRIRFVDIPYGDVWLRDTAPIFVRGARQARRFRFNGWGGKYIYPHDAELAAHLADRLGLQCPEVSLVSEGGALESDGEGTYLTTRVCLIDDNRNPGLDQLAVEQILARDLGARQLIWLDDGLQFDHTDGHIDNVARFVAPGTVTCMTPSGEDDPQRAVLPAIEAALRSATDHTGRPLKVHTIPSPGLVLGPDRAPMAASYMNFYIANRAVIVPGYGTPWDEPARAALQRLFPRRSVIMLPARAILTGGGSFHCVTQQVPVSAEVRTWVR